jgi:retinol dehydrogenase 12
MKKTIAITGGSSGIGYETARALARMGHRVVVLARNPDKGKQACDAIGTEGRKPELVVAELSSQASIRRAAEQILRDFDPVDVLIHNAGAWYSDFVLTEDGVERMLAVNHLAGFLLGHLLLPSLVRSGRGRIITVSSDSHFHGKMHWDDLQLSRNYHGLRAYAQSKLANVLFTYELDRRLKQRGLPVSTYAVQPGLVKTDIGVKHTISLHALAWKIRRLGGVSPEKGAETSVYLASSGDVALQSGLYWDKCKPKASSRDSHNEEYGRRLWEISEKLCGINDYFTGTAGS